MTPERMAEIRQMLTTVGPPAYEDAIGDLLAALDAEKARAKTAEAERDRREPTQAEGDRAEGGAPSHAQGECFVSGWTGRRCRHCARWTWGGPTACVGCVEREARQAAEDALARLREVARPVATPRRGANQWAKDSTRLERELSLPATDLAEAQRREWQAQGMEMVVSNLAAPMRDAALLEGGGDAARYLDDLIADIATDAAALRGER